jgi:hypothetical protein
MRPAKNQALEASLGCGEASRTVFSPCGHWAHRPPYLCQHCQTSARSGRDLFRIRLLRCEKVVDDACELVSRSSYRGACPQSPFGCSIEFSEMIVRVVQALCSKTESDGSPVLYVPRLRKTADQILDSVVRFCKRIKGSGHYLAVHKCDRKKDHVSVVRQCNRLDCLTPIQRQDVLVEVKGPAVLRTVVVVAIRHGEDLGLIGKLLR